MLHCVSKARKEAHRESPTAFHRFHLLGKDITGPMGNNLPKLGRVCVVNDFFWIQMMTKELFAVIILSYGAVNYTYICN